MRNSTTTNTTLPPRRSSTQSHDGGGNDEELDISVLSFSHQYYEQQGREREGDKGTEGEGEETNPSPVITVEEQAAAAASTLAGGMKGKSAAAMAQAVKDYKIMVEYKWLKRQAPAGVYLLPSSHSSSSPSTTTTTPSSSSPSPFLRSWHGVAFIRRAVYGRGVFKFVLSLPPAYNDRDTWPRVRFLTLPLFHPMVHPRTGELDIRSFYPAWDPDRHYIVTVLTLLKKIFYMKPPDFEPFFSAGPGKPALFNPEAAELLKTDPAEYLRRVEECVSRSQENVYCLTDDSPLRFTEPSPKHAAFHQALREMHDKGLEATHPPKFSILETLRGMEGGMEGGKEGGKEGGREGEQAEGKRRA
ncbi:ubiquitin-conjugating enzyme subfamily protein [Nannochloropsis oceanica]